MHYIAIDTETELIADRASIYSRSGDRIYTTPYTTPRLVLVSVADGVGSSLYTPADFAVKAVEWRTDPDLHLVFHNAVFDLDVLAAAGVDLYDLVEEGRVHDTMIMDWLVRLAQGEFDTPHRNPDTGVWLCPETRMRRLDELALEYARMTLNKDETIRLGFGQYLGRPLEDIPADFQKYAREDAIATYRAWDVLQGKLLVERAARGWGDLGEPLQVRAAVATYSLDKRGVAIDQATAERLRDAFLAQIRPLEFALVEAGLGRWKPTKVIHQEGLPGWRERTGWAMGADGLLHHYQGNRQLNRTIHRVCRPQFAVLQHPLQTALSQLEVDDPTQTPKRADGTLSIDADYWAPYIEEGTPLGTWRHYARLRKVLDTYLSVYHLTSEVYPRWRFLGARSGRMAASRPNIQNVSKRRAGIRSLFVPHAGFVFTKADYSAQEMFTLCESMARLGIRGPLYDVLSSGRDVHRMGAALCLGKPEGEITKLERQGQKVLNFGVPGGLGARKLARYAADTYGVRWTVDEAAAARDRFLRAFPDIDRFLRRMKDERSGDLDRICGRTESELRVELSLDSDANVIRALLAHPDADYQAIGIKAERGLVVTLPSGRIRTNCTFTEGANTYFQGLASDVTKAAFWRAHRAGLRVVLVVHDEIVIESLPDNIDKDAAALEDAMLYAFRMICPTIGRFARVEVTRGLQAWGEATDVNGQVMTI